MDSPNGIRLRLPLALAVAVVCVLGGAGLFSLLGGAGAAADPVRAQAARAALEPPATRTAHAHRGDLGVPGMSERELRAMETVTLGPGHAREHALLRRGLARRDTEQVSDEGRVRTAAVAALPPPGDPAEVGQWKTDKATFPIVAIHAAMLPTGKVMIFSYPAGQNYAEAWLWDPGTGSLVKKNPPDHNGQPANIWCAGQTFTADGELLVFGGNLEFSSPGKLWKGLNKVYTFNPFTETWTEQPDMAHGRWYPTGIRLPDGRIPIISGLDESGSNPASINPDVELFTPPATIGDVGTMSLIGRVGGAGEPPMGDLYPRMFAMPSGRTVLAGPGAGSTWAFDSISATGFSWSEVANLSRTRAYGTSVLLPGGAAGSTRILALGGIDYSGTPATTTSEIFDDANPGLGWQPGAASLVGRGHANTVLLPDGSMAEVGGGTGDVATFPSPLHAAEPEHRQVELWDPQTGAWRLGPAQSEARAYHSTALLLPDARVLSAGDEYNGDGTGATIDTGEIYEPPYLFRGPRPTIDSAPPRITSGAGFGVATPSTNIARAALVAPGAVTHGVDMNQRVIQLDVTRRVGCVDLTAPGVNAAPPGWYMLFLLNDQGVPSLARFVKLQTAGSATPCNAPAPPADQTAPAVTMDAPANGATVSGSVKVEATASDGVGVVGVQFKRAGQNLGAEDTTSPYSTAWDTTKVPDGAYTLTAVARDAAGNAATSAPVTVTVSNPPQATTQSPAGSKSPPGGAPVAPKNLAPAIRRLKLSRPTFRKGGQTKISFALSEAAKVELSFERRLSGQRSAYAHMKTTITLRGRAGSNSLKFRGKLSRDRSLAPGRYRVVLVATDATGKRSAAAHAGFRLLPAAAGGTSPVRAAALAWF